MAANPAPLSGGQPQPASTTPLAGAPPKKGIDPLIMVGAAVVIAVVVVVALALTPAAPLTDGVTAGKSIGEMSYSEIVASGQAVNCGITPVTGGEIAMSLKIKGENTRIEEEIPDAGKLVTVVKGDEIYNEMSGALSVIYASDGVSVDCDWIRVGSDIPEDAPSMLDERDVAGLNDLQSTDMDCSAGSFSDGVFDVSGTICTGQDIASAMAPPVAEKRGEELCYQLPESEQADCLAAL